ncbi:MAG: M14 family zinc carboxypeptidase [Planctomycetota bacterium]|nr:M14 family zinc carboxypeptidase [Planctomycetota bacterium]
MLGACLLAGLSGGPAALAQDGAAAGAGPEPGPPAAAVDELPGMVVTRPKPVYRDVAAGMALLEKWAEARGEAVEFVDLGTTPGERPLRGLLFGAPGARPLAERRVVFLVGGIDGRSLHGAEAVLGITAELLAEPASLPADLAFLSLPFAAPDGLDAELARLHGLGPGTGGRNARSIDADLDGDLDEDGPDDLDGDGLVTMMLIEDPAGAWCRAGDPRFLVPADDPTASGKRYWLLPEGRDDDNDGEFNEDGPGGVRGDRNFPIGWRGPHAPIAPGPLPFSEPESRAVRDVAASYDLLVTVLFDGHSGRTELASFFHPGGFTADGQPTVVPRAELPARDQLLYPLAELAYTTRHGARSEGGDAGAAPATFDMRESLGSPLEWLDAEGQVALRFPTWGPELGLGRSAPVESAGFRRGERPSPAVSQDELEDFDEPTCPTSTGGAWRRFLDERRGGIGFVDWHPVELAGVRGEVLVGGWEPGSIENPPEDQLSASVDLGLAFIQDLLASLPAVELQVLEASRDGELVTLRSRAVLAGSLPAAFLEGGVLTIGLDVPVGGRLIAGPAELAWDPLRQPEGPEIEWLVHAPAASRFQLRLTRGAGEVVLSRELRP